MTTSARIHPTSTCLLLIAAIGCGKEDASDSRLRAKRSPLTATDTSAAAAAATPTLNTFITNSIQIDNLSNPANPAGDANLFSGADPVDGSASVNLPAGGPGSYIDWNDIGNDLANHRLQDLNDATGKDPTSFPLSNACVGTSSVLSKMDLTYVAAANNQTYAYFAVQRSNNNGDAGYYWLFTKLPPHQNNQESCKAGQYFLRYDISVGDVLLVGHFHPSSTPLFRFFSAQQNVLGVDAVSAIDFTNTGVGGLWTENAAAVAASAVNTTPTSAGLFGADGIIKTAILGSTVAGGPTVDTEIFAEAAVTLQALTSGNLCGATFFGSVITRSSGSGGTSPDLKDLAGPAVFNFATLTPFANASADCSGTVTFNAGSVTPGQAVTCSWSGIPSGVTPTYTDATHCSGSFVAPPGTYTLTATVTDPITNCNPSVATAPVTVSSPIQVAATLSPTCTLDYGYASTVSGGTPPYAYAWAFTNSTSPSSTSASGSNTASAAGAVSATLQVTDANQCSGAGQASADIVTPLSAAVTLTPSCAASFDFAGTVSNGAPPYSYAWSFSGPPGSPPSPGSSTAQSGTVGATEAGGTYNAALVATDSRGCSAPASGSVLAFAPIAATASMTGGCTSSFNYASSVSGGSGVFSIAWAFSKVGDPSVVIPGSSTPSGGPVSVGAQPTGGGTFQGVVSYIDQRPDGLACSAGAQASTQVYTPPKVHIAVSTAPQACVTDSATFSVDSLQFGSGNFGYAWSGHPACVGSTSCTIDPSDSTFCATDSLSLTVSDTLCPPAQSNAGNYSKVTTVTASVQ